MRREMDTPERQKPAQKVSEMLQSVLAQGPEAKCGITQCCVWLTGERRLTVARKNKPRQLDRPQDERECSRPYCTNGRRKGGRYCVECHAEDMARRRREGTVAA